MTSEDIDKTHKIIERALQQLGEHFSSVQIVATVEDGESTTMFHDGVGNYYARYGSVKEWVAIEEAQAIEDEEDDDQED